MKNKWILPILAIAMLIIPITVIATGKDTAKKSWWPPLTLATEAPPQSENSPTIASVSDKITSDALNKVLIRMDRLETNVIHRLNQLDTRVTRLEEKIQKVKGDIDYVEAEPKVATTISDKSSSPKNFTINLVLVKSLKPILLPISWGEWGKINFGFVGEMSYISEDAARFLAHTGDIEIIDKTEHKVCFNHKRLNPSTDLIKVKIIKSPGGTRGNIISIQDHLFRAKFSVGNDYHIQKEIAQFLIQQGLAEKAL